MADTPDRFRGLTNNGGSRGDDGRWLRQLYTDHNITPPANLGAQEQRKPNQHSERRRQSGRRRTRGSGHWEVVSKGKEKWIWDN